MLVPLACLPLTWILVPAAVISDEGAFEMHPAAESFFLVLFIRGRPHSSGDRLH